MIGFAASPGTAVLPMCSTGRDQEIAERALHAVALDVEARRPVGVVRDDDDRVEPHRDAVKLRAAGWHAGAVVRELVGARVGEHRGHAAEPELRGALHRRDR